jgi:hypothetical protein
MKLKKSIVALGAVGVAIAAGVTVVAVAVGATGGSSQSATSPPGIGLVTSAQVGGLDAGTAATLRTENTVGLGSAVLGQRLLSRARTVPATINGLHLYLVPTDKGKLCVYLEASGESCTDALSSANPVHLIAEDRDGPGGAGPIVFGVAMDGVRSVTFTIGGQSQTVAVNGNSFEFQGTSDTDITSVLPISATLADGTVTPLP